MKRLLGLILLSVTVIVLARSVSHAEERKTLEYSGVVQEVNARDKTLVAAKKENLDLGMLFDASKTGFTNVAGLQDLKPGDRIIVRYDAVKARAIAVTVTRKN